MKKGMFATSGSKLEMRILSLTWKPGAVVGAFGGVSSAQVP